MLPWGVQGSSVRMPRREVATAVRLIIFGLGVGVAIVVCLVAVITSLKLYGAHFAFNLASMLASCLLHLALQTVTCLQKDVCTIGMRRPTPSLGMS